MYYSLIHILTVQVKISLKSQIPKNIVFEQNKVIIKISEEYT